MITDIERFMLVVSILSLFPSWICLRSLVDIMIEDRMCSFRCFVMFMASMLSISVTAMPLAFFLLFNGRMV